MFRIDQGKINLVPFIPTEMPHFCILASFRTSNTFFPQFHRAWVIPGRMECGLLAAGDERVRQADRVRAARLGSSGKAASFASGPVPAPEWRELCPSSMERLGSTKMDYLPGHVDAFSEDPARGADYRLDLQCETCVAAETVRLK